jgi:transcription-repair coupling factor (superfamily II helicase)
MNKITITIKDKQKEDIVLNFLHQIPFIDVKVDKKTISNSIIRELQRGGQVYFVNDKIAKLEQLSEMIEELVPFARVAIAHGQMTPYQLENVMMKFLEKKYNVLVCTKIIESGLDIPSVNTIIINRADNFGLAELYQLRGRVGRSNIKSFAYLITPPHSTLTKQAIRRLHALEEFSELGSGMNLALRDLEIRGAGNLLGKEQSGFIAEIGFDMYMQILDEAVMEIKQSELGEAIADILKIETKPKAKAIEVIIESDVSMLIPENYMEDENLRLETYQRLSKVQSFEELNSIKEEISDRFGKFPEEVISLFKHVELKIESINSGFEKITISGNNAEFYFHLSEDNPAMLDGRFEKIIAYINQKNSDDTRLVQTKKALMVRQRLFKADSGTEKLEEVRDTLKRFKGV